MEGIWRACLFFSLRMLEGSVQSTDSCLRQKKTQQQLKRSELDDKFFERATERKRKRLLNNESVTSSQGRNVTGGILFSLLW